MHTEKKSAFSGISEKTLSSNASHKNEKHPIK
jgi:hypothetical protein